MANITLTTNWQSVANSTWAPGTGLSVTFYLDAKYSTQSIANNTTTIQTRLRSVINSGYGNGYNYSFSCSYANTVSGSGLWTLSTTTITSGETTITHNDDGTKSVSLSANATITGIGMNVSLSGTATMPRIQRYAIATSGTDFTDEENPTLTFSNVGLYGLRAKILVGETEIFSDDLLDQYATSYTYTLSNNQRNQLRQLCTGQTMTVDLAICSVSNSRILYVSKANVIMTVVNATPTFTYTTEEQNANVVALVGTDSGNTLIGNVSELKFEFTPTTYKYATVSSITIAEGTPSHIIQSFAITSSPYEYTIDVSNVTDSGKFVATLTDSRGLKATIEDNQRTLLPYNIVRINNYSFKRQSPISSNVIFNGEFSYWGNVGSYTNTPVVKYKLDNGSWVTIPSSNYTIDSTNHKLTITNYEIANILPYNQIGQFSISIEDALTSKEDTGDNGKVLKGVPTFDAGEHDLKVNGDLYVADINGDNAVNVLDEIENASLEVYSTTEQAIGTWIDGKTIYRKTYEISVGANTTNTSTNLSSLGYNRIWINDGKSFNYYNGNTNTTTGINWYNGTSDYGLAYVNANKILNVKNISNSARYYYITLEYTKTNN